MEKKLEIVRNNIEIVKNIYRDSGRKYIVKKIATVQQSDEIEIMKNNIEIVAKNT